MPFLFIFVLIPLAEIAAFVYIGGAIGLMQTLLIALMTAAIGGLIIKYQGLITMENVKQSLIAGRTPISEIFDGFCLVASGALLITPGFVTDFIGFLLLIPIFRKLVKHIIIKNFDGSKSSIHVNQGRKDHNDNIIEGDYERVDDNKKDQE